MTILDVEKLLAPIRPDAPCGTAIEEDENALAAAYEMDTAYKSARLIQKSRVELEKLPTKALRDGFRKDKKELPNDPARNPDWYSVANLGCQLLYQCSKDVKLLSRLFEPMTRLYGLEGFLAVAQGAIRLVESYGSELYPRSDDDPLILWQNLAREQYSDTFLDSFKWIRIESRNPVCFGCQFRIDVTLTLPSLTDEDVSELKSDSDFLDEDAFKEKRAELEPSNVETFRTLLSDALVAAKDLDSLLQSKAPGTEFRFNKVVDILEEISAWLSKTLPPSNLPQETAADDAPPQANLGAGPATAAVAMKTGPVASREDALRQLKQVAEFFRKTEPHSPLSYALEQTVRWGGMSLPELLKDFIDNNDVLNGVYRRMGIPIPEE